LTLRALRVCRRNPEQERDQPVGGATLTESHAILPG
jgi:hypothetical protein